MSSSTDGSADGSPPTSRQITEVEVAESVLALTGASGDEAASHPLLNDGTVLKRDYQLLLAANALGDDTLVCLPTGLGKTVVSLLVTARRLQWADEHDDLTARSKAVVLAPTKPLVDQHTAFYREALSLADEEIVAFTGEVSPDDRERVWDDARVIVATPQVVRNDLVDGRVSLHSVVHLTFDECHRATGDYAYLFIAEKYHADARLPLTTGLSASPGSSHEDILDVCRNLGIENIEVNTESDSEVEKYTHRTSVTWEKIDLPDELIQIRDLIRDTIKDRMVQLKDLGVTNSARKDVSRKELFSLRDDLQEMIDNNESEGFEGMSLHAEVMKLLHAVDAVESQGSDTLISYLDRLENEAASSGGSKASSRAISDDRIRKARQLAAEFDDLHPKLRETRRRVVQTLIDGGERIIVFTESRDTAETLTTFLDDHVDAHRFVGQGNKDGSSGMSQTEQADTLNAFRNGEYDVLVSTSVAEEGLDIPEVDLVLFYAPVTSAIRSVQRKGRTGRQQAGEVLILVAQDTRDEARYWSTKRKESQMADALEDLRDRRGELVSELGDEVETPVDRENAALDRYGSSDADDGDGTDDDDEAVPATAEPDADDEGDGEAGGDPKAETAGEGEGEGDDDGGGDADADDGVVATARGDDASGEAVEIVVDRREMDSSIPQTFSLRDDVETRLETLAVGDYVLSDRVAVERKSVADFLDTLLGSDRSLFEQVGDMASHYSRSLIIIEGDPDRLYAERNVHPNAIRGALSSLAVEYNVSVLFARDEDDTAALLRGVAEREQESDEREVSVHGEKSSKTMAEQQEYVVSSIAEVGPVTARSLLASLGSVTSVVNADADRLTEVEGVGDVTADRIREVLDAEYDDEDG